MSIALPMPASRRGACPSLDAPMQTGDGLLARLRIAGGRMAPAQLGAIATLARVHGNGLIEITARGNLQVRGLTPVSSIAFARAVQSLATIERGLVVETPPLAGDDPSEIMDPRPLALAIRDAAEPLASRLGPKVTVIVDGGGQIGLDALKADIRLTAIAAEQWAVSIGGREAFLVGHDALLATLRALRQLAELGPGARATDLPGAVALAQHRPGGSSIGAFALTRGSAIGIALPFGSSDHAALAALAAVATDHGVHEFRLAPYHGLLAVGAQPSFREEAATLGFITAPDDPRTRISACIGSDGCASGHVPARTVAACLAAAMPADLGRLHVSGCAKGCAHPRRAEVTLVGQADGYGLVISGTAGDTPRALLRADQLGAAVAARQG